MFTFLAIAYSTTRAATQTKALSGGRNSASSSSGGAIRLEGEEGGGDADDEAALVTSQPKTRRMDSMRYQALLSAVEDGYV